VPTKTKMHAAWIRINRRHLKVPPNRRPVFFSLRIPAALVLLLCSLAAAHAGTVTVPAINYGGTFTITWTGGPYTNIYERVNGGNWTGGSQMAGNSLTLTRPAGSYAFRADTCTYVPGPPPTYYPYVWSCLPGTPSNTFNVITSAPAAPSISIASVDYDGSYTLSWNATTHATEYRWMQRVNGGGWGGENITTGTSVALSNSTGVYGYVVRACNPIGCSSYSGEQSITVITTPPAGAPSISLPAADNDGSYSFSWNSIANATEYRWMQRVNGGGWGGETVTSSTSAAVTSSSNGIYGYVVRACNPHGCGGYSSEASITVYTTPPSGTPSISLQAADYDGSYSLSWNSIAHATEYRWMQRVNGGSWGSETVTSGTSTSVTNSSGTYGYVVRACNPVGCGSYSGEQSIVVITTPPSGTPTISLPSVDYDGSYSLSWNSIANATEYRWQQRVNGGAWGAETAIAGTSVSLTNGNGTYGYRVRACNPVGCSGYSSEQSIVVNTIPPASAPSISLSSVDYDGSYSFSWNSIANATEYRWQQRLNGGGWGGENSTSGTSASVTNVGGTYGYRVRACNPAGCSGYSSEQSIVVVTTPPSGTPSISLQAVDYDGSYSLSWNSIANATEYRWQQRVNSGAWGGETTTAGTSVSLTNGAGTYGYRVRACNPNGCGGYSSEALIMIVGDTTSYKYDELGRLIEVRHPNAVSNDYEYDAADNRRSKQSSSD
jgi:YD repeat-containing protein